MRALAPDAAAERQAAAAARVRPEAVAAGELEVPDPYYGGEDGFEQVLDMVDRACDGLIEEIRAERPPRERGRFSRAAGAALGDGGGVGRAGRWRRHQRGMGAAS